MKADDFSIGTRVRMVNCLEAENFKGRIWTTISEPWKIGKKEWVVLLDGYRGGFAVNYLEVVGFPQPKRTGIALIAKERERQINVEDWPPEHDDQLINGELSDAAAIYAMSPVFLDRKIDGGDTILREIWPFGLEWYKTTPGKRIRNLEKAGALIAAEIDRLLRMEEKLNDRNLG